MLLNAVSSLYGLMDDFPYLVIRGWDSAHTHKKKPGSPCVVAVATADAKELLCMIPGKLVAYVTAMATEMGN